MPDSGTDIELLAQLYEEHGPSLHRLTVMLGAEKAAENIQRAALKSLGHRLHSVVDPLERLEYLQEQVVHLSRSTRGSNGVLSLPKVEDHRQNQILDGIRSLPIRFGEILIISHYLAVYGPELAHILRMTIRTTNTRLEEALNRLRRAVGNPETVTEPGMIESLSQEVTAALRSAARTIAPPDTERLGAELVELGGSSRHGIATWLAVLVIVGSLLLGAWLALLISTGEAETEEQPAATAATDTDEDESPSPSSSASSESKSLPAQVRSIPIYYVGREDGLLYRERRDLPAGGNLIEASLDAILSLAPLDPDYRSPWRSGSVIGVEVVGNLLTVDLSEKAFEDIDTTEEALSAANQILYTATELSGNPELRLKLLMEGKPPPGEFEIPDDGLTLSDLSPMPLAWIASPKNGDNVSAGEVTISGTVKPSGSAPVVTVSTEAGGNVASVTAQTATTADEEGWRPWSVQVDLKPGSYLITATSKGEDASGKDHVHTETKTILVS